MINSDIDSILRNHTCELLDLPPVLLPIDMSKMKVLIISGNQN